MQAPAISTRRSASAVSWPASPGGAARTSARASVGHRRRGRRPRPRRIGDRRGSRGRHDRNGRRRCRAVAARRREHHAHPAHRARRPAWARYGVIQTSSILYGRGARHSDLADAIGVAPVLIGSAVISVVGVATALVLTAGRGAPEPEVEARARLLDLPILAGLPSPRLEEAARRMLELPMGAGDANRPARAIRPIGST